MQSGAEDGRHFSAIRLAEDVERSVLQGGSHIGSRQDRDAVSSVMRPASNNKQKQGKVLSHLPEQTQLAQVGTHSMESKIQIQQYIEMKRNMNSSETVRHCTFFLSFFSPTLGKGYNSFIQERFCLAGHFSSSKNTDPYIRYICIQINITRNSAIT